MFPSPCGVWVVSKLLHRIMSMRTFPSPCGVWVVSYFIGYQESVKSFPSPCGVWVVSSAECAGKHGHQVSVPLRGVGCFVVFPAGVVQIVFPSPCGVWVVSEGSEDVEMTTGFRPLAGCGLFPYRGGWCYVVPEFPSPCGVWVVSPRISL